MGKTSSQVKARWNAAHYDCVNVRLPKGSKKEIQAAAKKRGISMTQLIRQAILHYVSADERDQMPVLTGWEVVEKAEKADILRKSPGGGGYYWPALRTAVSRAADAWYTDSRTDTSAEGVTL